jgi:hypothetical protein
MQLVSAVGVVGLNCTKVFKQLCYVQEHREIQNVYDEDNESQALLLECGQRDWWAV